MCHNFFKISDGYASCVNAFEHLAFDSVCFPSESWLSSDLLNTVLARLTRTLLWKGSSCRQKGPLGPLSVVHSQ